MLLSSRLLVTLFSVSWSSTLCTNYNVQQRLQGTSRQVSGILFLHSSLLWNSPLLLSTALASVNASFCFLNLVTLPCSAGTPSLSLL